MQRTNSPVLVGSLLALSSTAFYGTAGIFAKLLAAYQISPLVMVWGRSFVAIAIVGTALVLMRPAGLLIKRRDLPYFIAQGLFGQALMSWFGFTAFTLTSVAVAVLIIYTAPALILVLAAVFLREPIVRQKVVGLGATMVGLPLVVGLLEAGQVSVSPLAIAAALGASLCYAVFTLVTKVSVARYSPWTAIFYGHLFGLAFQTAGIVLSGTTIPVYTSTSLGLHAASGAIMVVAFALYFSALARIEASRGSIIMMAEPVLAAVMAYLFLNETLTALQMAGAVLILAGAVVAQLPSRRPIGGSAASVAPGTGPSE